MLSRMRWRPFLSLCGISGFSMTLCKAEDRSSRYLLKIFFSSSEILSYRVRSFESFPSKSFFCCGRSARSRAFNLASSSFARLSLFVRRINVRSWPPSDAYSSKSLRFADRRSIFSGRVERIALRLRRHASHESELRDICINFTTQNPIAGVQRDARLQKEFVESFGARGTQFRAMLSDESAARF